MKTFLVGLLLGLSFAALPTLAFHVKDPNGGLPLSHSTEQRGIFFNPSNPMVPETWSQQQTREAIENPIDQYGNSYTNDGGFLTPNFSPGSRRGPC